MAQSNPSLVSSASPATISPPRAPPTPPPESDSRSAQSPSSPRIIASDFPPISPTTVSASSSPSQSTITTFPSSGHPTFASVVTSSSLPTSVSSPAWFPPFDAEQGLLVASSTSATLVDSADDGDGCSSPKSPPSKTLEFEVEITQQPVEVEDGEIVDIMSDLTLQAQDDSALVLDDSPILPSQKPITPKRSPSPPRAPSRPTIPLPPVDDDDLQPPRAQIIASPPRTKIVSSPSRLHTVSSPSRAPISPSRQRQESASAHLQTQTPVQVATAESKQLPAPADSKHAYTPDSEKTPNVYINGLPPNFPEDQLFALAAPFGTVRSVRTFTRHVGDTETGYGFVLFENVACAEKCINSLRRYRNLHPTFSKQVHKIPGTMYAPPRTTAGTSDAAHGAAAASSDGGGTSSLAGWEQESAGDASADSTFKAKMERLSDKGSTNLYIEGLPLSVDDASLAALVSPYSIRSSRFFQTKLSTPPRIIAFVRLETRSAAEEIIERLHGRMVRGWNDPGSRISVRFADTSEQRELRRQERLAREGDHAGNQLSIAHATLLNLRGKELNHNRPTIAGGIALDYDANYGRNNFPSDVGYPQNDFEVDYSRIPARYPSGSNQYDYASQQQLLDPVQSQRMNPAMASLLQSLQASAARPHEREAYTQQEYRSIQQQQQLAALSLATNPGRSYGPQGLGLSSAQHAAHGGYTPTEEFILRARSNSLPLAPGGKRRPTALDLSQAQLHREQHEMDIDRAAAAGANIGVGVRGYRTQAAMLSFPHQQQHEMSEEDFHAATSIPHQLQLRPQQQQQQFDLPHSLHPQQRISQQQQQQPRGPSQTRDFGRNLNQQQHHYQRGIPASRNMNHNHINSNGADSTSNGIYEQQQRTTAQRGLNNTHRNGASNGYNSSHTHSHSHSHSQHSMYPPDEQPSPPLVSPALTYSSRSSASAVFSPTTPFFNTFDEEEAFRATPGKKMNARTSTR
ncbi:hypothetical protein FB45DRAFT_1086922 [Roridomyces roridus]|uniref:RRM domain-containing protein n=1 Tax=Roridomyces roridus TaxID=1738132 RepID=A0AAD7FK83_9AGAR|nr:hypothetical protein FB45DRAFT_1086922 [Roridomyces roridus]